MKKHMHNIPEDDGKGSHLNLLLALFVFHLKEEVITRLTKKVIEFV